MINLRKPICFPACFVQLPRGTEQRSAAFYLAAEEFIAHHLPEDNYVFIWQLSPTVVIGRNQVAHQELNLDFCHAHNIQVIRRKSGGGAIYADQGNIMISLITGPGPVPPIFLEYAQVEVEGLKHLGADVLLSGRNDVILSNQGKICGNAFYHLPNRNIVHGTMLYDTNLENMTGALTPNTAKLQAAGVQSVRSRIGLLKDTLSISVEELRSALKPMLTNRSILLTDQDVQQIEQLEQAYYDPSFLYGSSSKSDVQSQLRIPNCGTLQFHIHLRGSQIKDVQLTGDYFEYQDASVTFQQALQGVQFSKSGIQEALETHHPEVAIRNLSIPQVLETLFNKE